MGLSRTALHYDSKAKPDNEQLSARLVELAGERRRFGYRRLHALVRREGVQANHKRIYRLYSDAGLSVRRCKKRHGVAVERQALERTTGPNQVQAGKPTQNAFIESFNGRFRDECLNDHWFTSLQQARILIAAWRRDYNQHRPHSALNYQTPAEFAAGYRATPPAQPATEECL